MCNILELSGDLLSLSVPGGTEKIAALWFARGYQYPGDCMTLWRQWCAQVKVINEESIAMSCNVAKAHSPITLNKS